MIRYFDRAGQPMRQEDWLTSYEDFEAQRRVGLDVVVLDGVEVRISTVWLGLDHNFLPGGPPLIFETMIFGLTGEYEDWQRRYSTEEQARRGHEEAVAAVRRCDLAALDDL